MTVTARITRWSRRTLLTGLGGAGALLAAPIVRVRRALAQGPVKRLLVVFTANGTIEPAWSPTGTDAAFDLPPGSILEPLAPFRSKLLVLGGVNMSSQQSGPGNAHMKGAGHFLTARALLPGTMTGGGGATAGFASGISVDQHIANSVGQATRFPSLELSLGGAYANVRTRLAYRGSNQPLPTSPDPFAVYARIFAGIGATANAAELERMLAERRSVLDYVKEELALVNGRIGAEEKLRLELHLESLRGVERRLAPPGAGCKPGSLGTRIDVNAVANYPAVSKLQIDLVALAFACDLVRVVTLMYNGSTSGQTFPWLSIPEGHHDLSHEGDSNTAAGTKLIAINRWYAEQYAYLLGKLQAIQEPGATAAATALDNTIVMWGSELGKGNSHSSKNIPYVLAGSCGGFFKTGRHMRYEGAPHSNLLLSLCHAMGLRDTTFGDPKYCTGPMAGLA